MADNVKLIEGVYEGLARGDVQPLLDISDENIEWNEAEHFPYWRGGPFVGTQAVLEEVLGKLPQDFDGFTVARKRIVGCGDTVLSEVRYRATVKSNGKALDAQVAHVWDFRDGKLVRFQQYADTWHVADVTGFVPEGAGSAAGDR
jgi:ketosteroid isomerase-like protein